MTFIYEPDLDMLKIYLHAKINFLGEGLEHYRQTDTQRDATEKHYDTTFACGKYVLNMVRRGGVMVKTWSRQLCRDCV